MGPQFITSSGTQLSVIMADENGRPGASGLSAPDHVVSMCFESTVAGAKAVEELDGYELNGRTISVSESKQRAPRRGARAAPPNERHFALLGFVPTRANPKAAAPRRQLSRTRANTGCPNLADIPRTLPEERLTALWQYLPRRMHPVP